MIVISSCKKAEDRSCWKSAGKSSDTIIYVNNFSKLSLNENMSFELIQDSINSIHISGGKNLISQIQVQQNSDGSIDINNLNKCNFLRYKNDQINGEYVLYQCLNHYRQPLSEFAFPYHKKKALYINLNFFIIDGNKLECCFNFAQHECI